MLPALPHCFAECVASRPVSCEAMRDSSLRKEAPGERVDNAAKEAWKDSANNFLKGHKEDDAVEDAAVRYVIMS